MSLRAEVYIEGAHATVTFLKGDATVFAYDMSSKDAVELARILEVPITHVPVAVDVGDHHFLEGAAYDR